VVPLGVDFGGSVAGSFDSVFKDCFESSGVCERNAMCPERAVLEEMRFFAQETESRMWALCRMWDVFVVPQPGVWSEVIVCSPAWCFGQIVDRWTRP